jgi:hypothetical protein
MAWSDALIFRLKAEATCLLVVAPIPSRGFRL